MIHNIISVLVVKRESITRMAMRWMMRRAARYLMVHGSPHREVHHIVVRVSERLVRGISGQGRRNIKIRSGPLTSLQQPLYSFTMLPTCREMSYS